MRSYIMAGLATTALIVGGVPAQARARAHHPFRAHAEPAAARLDRLERLLKSQAARLDEQARTLDDQTRQIASQATELASLRDARPAQAMAVAQAGTVVAPVTAGPPPVDAAFATSRDAVHAPSATVVGPDSSQASNGGPPLVAPVGEAPPDTKVEVAALPEETSVLTPKGGWYIEPSFSYTRSSANVLVFRGVEIVTGVQVGLLQANSAARDTLVESMDVRYGLTSRLEVEARAPFVDRRDRVQTVAQRDQSVTQSQSLSADDLGDVELAARYQINAARPGQPIYVAGLRYKSDTGKSPFDLNYDQFGAATNLATGSGFNALEPSISLLLPTDPAVIFAGLSYIHNFGKNVNRTIGGAQVTDVEPGDSIGFSAGFGFAINPRFSFSLGYRHNYIFPTYTTLNGSRQRSNVLEVGAYTFGWSYALTSRIAFASTVELGATSDAPDLNLIVRLPIRF